MRGNKLSEAQMRVVVKRLGIINKTVEGLLPPGHARKMYEEYARMVRIIPMEREAEVYRVGNNIWRREGENETSGIWVPGAGFLPNKIIISLQRDHYEDLMSKRPSAKSIYTLAHEFGHNISRSLMQEGLEARNLYNNPDLLVRRMAELYAYNMPRGNALKKAKSMVGMHPKACAAIISKDDNEAFSDGIGIKVLQRLRGGRRVPNEEIEEFMQSRPYPVKIAFARMLKQSRGRPKKDGLLTKAARAIDETSAGFMERVGGIERVANVRGGIEELRSRRGPAIGERRPEEEPRVRQMLRHRELPVPKTRRRR